VAGRQPHFGHGLRKLLTIFIKFAGMKVARVEVVLKQIDQIGLHSRGGLDSQLLESGSDEFFEVLSGRNKKLNAHLSFLSAFAYVQFTGIPSHVGNFPSNLDQGLAREWNLDFCFETKQPKKTHGLAALWFAFIFSMHSSYPDGGTYGLRDERSRAGSVARSAGLDALRQLPRHQNASPVFHVDSRRLRTFDSKLGPKLLEFKQKRMEPSTF